MPSPLKKLTEESRRKGEIGHDDRKQWTRHQGARQRARQLKQLQREALAEQQPEWLNTDTKEKTCS